MQLHHSGIKDWRTLPFVQVCWICSNNSINALNAVKTWRECRFQPSRDEVFFLRCPDVADTDDDHRKEGVDGDPEIRKNHDDEADGQNPEDCQEDIQRHPFSWKFVVKVQSSFSCMWLVCENRWNGLFGPKNGPKLPTIYYAQQDLWKKNNFLRYPPFKEHL